MKNEIGDGENSIIGRDDGILRALNRLVGGTSFGRNVDYFSTPNDTRPDFVGRWRNVQIVFCEEKDDDIDGAVEDLWKKFRFIQNYSAEIRYMFAFAISRDNFLIMKFQRNGVNQAPPLLGTVWFESTLNSLPDRMQCIIASLNVGRILKFYIQSNFISPSPIPLGTRLSRQNGKSIVLFYDYFVVKAIQEEDRLKELQEFYETTYNVVNNLEFLYKKPVSKVHPDGFHTGKRDSRQYLEIYLKPVGQVRRPCTPQELKNMLLNILYCIKQLHSLGYLHTDIRWPNIVCYEGAWFLIDCYDFCKITDTDRRRTVKGFRGAGYFSPSPEWLPEDDLCQIVMLLDEDAFRTEQFAMFRFLQGRFVSQVASGDLSVDYLISSVEQIEV